MTTKKSTAKKSRGKAAKNSSTPPSRRWSAKVDTDSTHPDPGLFLESPRTIANALATKRVSPQGPASGMRMLNFYINRAGKNLSKERVAELEKVKGILSGIIARQKGAPMTKKAKTGTEKSAAEKTANKKSS